MSIAEPAAKAAHKPSDAKAEAVPAKIARLISEQLTIPTIGIGAGAGCDGQILL